MDLGSRSFNLNKLELYKDPVYSVTRLGIFYISWWPIFLQKLPKFYGKFLGHFK